MWSHSYKNFTILGAPVAQLVIPPTFYGLDEPEVECNVLEVNLISNKGNIHQINLTKKHGSFTFLKYREVSQLG
jgi:hypothetical protein